MHASPSSFYVFSFIPIPTLIPFSVLYICKYPNVFNVDLFVCGLLFDTRVLNYINGSVIHILFFSYF